MFFRVQARSYTSRAQAFVTVRCIDAVSATVYRLMELLVVKAGRCRSPLHDKIIDNMASFKSCQAMLQSSIHEERNTVSPVTAARREMMDK